jgi:hypothetical protein
VKYTSNQYVCPAFKVTALFVAGKVNVSPLTVAGPTASSSQFVSIDTLKSAR